MQAGKGLGHVGDDAGPVGAVHEDAAVPAQVPPGCCGTWWPTTSALLLTAGYDVKPTTDRYAYGVLAGVGGMGLSALALAQKGIGECAALMTHSGGAVGTFDVNR